MTYFCAIVPVKLYDYKPVLLKSLTKKVRYIFEFEIDTQFNFGAYVMTQIAMFTEQIEPKIV